MVRRAGMKLPARTWISTTTHAAEVQKSCGIDCLDTGAAAMAISELEVPASSLRLAGVVSKIVSLLKCEVPRAHHQIDDEFSATARGMLGLSPAPKTPSQVF